MFNSKFLSFQICHSVFEVIIIAILLLVLIIIILLFWLLFFLLLKALLWFMFSFYYYIHIYWFVSTIIVCYFSSCPHLLLFPIFISVMTIATTIAFIVIFMNFSILLFSCVVVLFYFRLNNFFSDMKGLRLVNYVVSLFVPLFVYLIYLSSWSRRVKIHNLTTFPQFPKSIQFNSFIAILT